MRKLISILLFVCLCFTILGYHLVFNFQLAQVKAEMKIFLNSKPQHKDLMQLSLNEEESKQLYWENENEFQYNGEMYDVIEKKVNGKKIIIHCISDSKETSILNEYHKNNKRNSSNSSIVQLIITQFLLPADYCICPPEKKKEKTFIDYCSLLQNIASSVLIPPPDAC